MNFSELELKLYLNKELVGKDFGYNWDWDVTKVFRAFVKEHGLDESDFSVSRYGIDRRRAQGQTCFIVYKNKQELGYIEAKKLKGAHHYSWGGGYNDWTFKDFGVVFYAKDFDTAVDVAKQRMIDKENAETKMQNDAVELYKVAQEKFGPNARYVVEYLKNHYWTIDIEAQAKKIEKD